MASLVAAVAGFGFTAWKAVIVLSLALNVAIVGLLAYALLVYQTNLAAFSDFGALCQTSEFDSIAAATMVGRLDVVSALLGFLGIVIAFAGLGGFWLFRREAIGAARDTAKDIAPEALQSYMDGNGTDLIRASLDHGEVVAMLQKKIAEFGLEDAEDASVVDDDADWEDPAK